MRKLLLAFVLMTLPVAAQSARADERWSELPPLPVPVSGHFAGQSRGALIVAGGANFPVPLFEGGTKKWVSEVRVLPRGAAAWQSAASLPQPLAYGASVTAGDTFICLGGGDAQTHTNAAFALEWKNGALRRGELPPLPKSCAFMGAALLGDTIYVVGGQETPTSTSAFNSCWALDWKKKNAAWRELPPLPGAGRILPVVAAQRGALYVFSGARLAPNAEGKAQRTYIKDAWRFVPDAGWESVAAPPAPLVAAPALAWGEDEIVVFSGDDGALAARVQELKDAHPGFRREVLVYNARRDVWRVADTLPISLVTTNAVRLKNAIVIPGGEDRPGHRNPRVLKYLPKAKP